INFNNSLNSKGTPFLNVRTAKRYGPDGVSELDKIYRDPWGHPYLVWTDLNYDNRILNPFPEGAGQARPNALSDKARFIAQPVIAMSFGPDGLANFNLPANA